jgi:hypothetical protein
MGNFPMALCTSSPFPHPAVHDHRGLQARVDQQFLMAAYAIALNNFGTCLQNTNDLPFLPEGKKHGMPHAIVGFEIVFAEHIVVRNMTIVTMCFFPVGTVVPRHILRSHDVTVHTRFRPVRQIRMCLPQIKSQQSETGYKPQKYDNWKLPPRWRHKIL